MLGIGADHRNSAEGLAWKQNKDFENLLRRLNAANGGGPEEAPMKIDGFTKGASMTTVDADAEKDTASSGDEHVGAEPKEEKRSKKKRKKGEDGEEGERRKKKHKKSKTSEDRSESDGGSKKEKKSKKAEKEASSESTSGVSTPEAGPSGSRTLVTGPP